MRTGKTLSLQAPQIFRPGLLVEEAHAGDVVGTPNHGTLRTRHPDRRGGAELRGRTELRRRLRRVRLPDAMKAKKQQQALQEMAEEGVAGVPSTDGSPALVGVVGRCNWT